MQSMHKKINIPKNMNQKVKQATAQQQKQAATQKQAKLDKKITASNLQSKLEFSKPAASTNEVYDSYSNAKMSGVSIQGPDNNVMILVVIVIGYFIFRGALK